MKNIKIQILDKECWWGGIIQDGIFMPYKEIDFKRDLYKEQLYNQSSPLLLSSKGRYIWCEEPFEYRLGGMEISLNYESDEIIFSEGHENVRGAFKHASKTYFPANGALPDSLIFTAPQYNTWIEMMYDPTQVKVLEYAQAILDNGMPPGVIIIDDNWQEDYGVWKFHEGRFPEPKLMINQLHKMGFKVMLWVCNFISPDSLTSRIANSKEFLVKTIDGKPAVAEWWNGYSTMLDLTNAEAVNYFTNQLNELMLEYGVDGFKFDAGDLNHFNDNFICKNKINGTQYSEAWAEIGTNYKLNEYRACWKQGGKALVQRLSDKNHSWELNGGLGSLIPNGLAQGILGYSFICPDMIGGGEYINFLENSKELDMELIVRNAQCAALFPIMQFSVAPWRILDREHLKICVEMAKLHENFGEKILKLAKNASETGEPIIRYMEYVFPNSGYENIKEQFMLGDNILVAPVLEKGAITKQIVFPEGKWIGDDKSIVEGACTITVDAPLSRLPWYEKMV